MSLNPNTPVSSYDRVTSVWRHSKLDKNGVCFANGISIFNHKFVYLMILNYRDMSDMKIEKQFKHRTNNIFHVRGVYFVQPIWAQGHKNFLHHWRAFISRLAYSSLFFYFHPLVLLLCRTWRKMSLNTNLTYEYLRYIDFCW